MFHLTALVVCFFWYWCLYRFLVMSWDFHIYTTTIVLFSRKSSSPVECFFESIFIQASSQKYVGRLLHYLVIKQLGVKLSGTPVSLYLRYGRESE